MALYYICMLNQVDEVKYKQRSTIGSLGLSDNESIGIIVFLLSTTLLK